MLRGLRGCKEGLRVISSLHTLNEDRGRVGGVSCRSCSSCARNQKHRSVSAYMLHTHTHSLSLSLSLSPPRSPPLPIHTRASRVHRDPPPLFPALPIHTRPSRVHRDPPLPPFLSLFTLAHLLMVLMSTFVSFCSIRRRRRAVCCEFNRKWYLCRAQSCSTCCDCFVVV